VSSEVGEKRDDLEWVPVAVVRMDGEPGPLYVNVAHPAAWSALYDEVLTGWDPPLSDMAGDPQQFAPPFTITFTAMQRGQYDRRMADTTKEELACLLDSEGYGAWVDTEQLVETLREHRELVLRALGPSGPEQVSNLAAQDASDGR
jgi:hypothetical protein